MNKLILIWLFQMFMHTSVSGQDNPPPKVLNTNTAKLNLTVSDSLLNAPIRFSVAMGEDYGKAKDYNMRTMYNTNIYNVVINSGEITIKKSGLYHFEGFVAAEVFADPDERKGFTLPQFTAGLKIGTYDYYSVAYKELMQGTGYYANGKLESRHMKLNRFFSMDIYIIAPSTLKFNRNFTSTVTNESLHYSRGWLSGYRISD